MTMQITLSPRLTQELRLTPQLIQQQAILLANHVDLVERARQELDENVMLEDAQEAAPDVDGARDGEGTALDPAARRKEEADRLRWESYVSAAREAPPEPASAGAGADTDERPPIEDGFARGETLAEHLLAQLRLSRAGDDERRVGALIIGNLDEEGYLRDVRLDELAEEAGVAPDVAERALARIQRFDPVGVAARDLPECLLIQAEQQGCDDAVVRAIITSHLPSLRNRRLDVVAAALRVGLDEVRDAVEVIAGLDPRPGRAVVAEPPQFVTPDVVVVRSGDRFFVQVNGDGLPRLRISQRYLDILRGRGEAARFVTRKLEAARFFIDAVERRRRTMVLVVESIIERQRAFFESGDPRALRPLRLRDVAEDIAMSESTASRATSNKYVQTAFGVLPLRQFFGAGYAADDGEEASARSVKLRLRDLIAAEDPGRPLSDEALARVLKRQGIRIARRTIAKYREQLRILPSQQRGRREPRCAAAG